MLPAACSSDFARRILRGALVLHHPPAHLATSVKFPEMPPLARLKAALGPTVHVVCVEGPDNSAGFWRGGAAGAGLVGRWAGRRRRRTSTTPEGQQQKR